VNPDFENDLVVKSTWTSDYRTRRRSELADERKTGQEKADQISDFRQTGGSVDGAN